MGKEECLCLPEDELQNVKCVFHKVVGIYNPRNFKLAMQRDELGPRKAGSEDYFCHT